MSEKMAGDDVEIITLVSSEDEEESTETSADLPGKVLFEKFVSTCSPLIADSKKRATMVGLLEKRFDQAKEAFQESEEFANILTEHIKELSTKKKDAFKHILDVVNVLKSAAAGDSKRKHKKKKRDDAKTRASELKGQQKKRGSGSESDKSKRERSRDRTSGSERDSTAPESDSYTRLKEEQSKEANDNLSLELKETSEQEVKTQDVEKVGDTDKTDENQTEEILEEIPLVEPLVPPEEQNDKQEQSGQAATNTEINSGNNVKNIEVSKKTQKTKKRVTHKQIRKYERLLHKLSQEIKRFSEKELTLDEMDEEDSTHIMEYQLRKRAMKVYNKLCELKKVQPSTGRVSERRIKFQGTRYPEINKKLEKLANLPEYFPDFQDVFIMITKVNEKKGLGLDRRRIYNTAKDAFEMIGKKLQQRRQEDFLANFSSHPTLDFVEARDPAELDLELQMKLKTNYRVGSEKLSEVTRSYEEKQKTNEELGVNMEVASQNSESEQSAGEIEDEAPKKKRRRINLITVVDDEDEDDNAGDDDGDSQTATEDDTADEATEQSAHEADDEEDESDGDAKEEDENDDGAEDFGALSPLTTDEEDEPITDEENNSVEEVIKSPQNDGEPEIEQSENNAAHMNPPDASANDVSSSAEASSVSDTSLSTTNSLNNSNQPTPHTVSLNNGLKQSHEQITAGKQTIPIKTKQVTVPNGNHASGQAKHVEGNSNTTGPDHPSSSAAVAAAPAAVQVVDSSSSLPIIVNVMSLRHETDTGTDGSPPLTASDPGRVSPVPCPASVLAVHGHTGVLAKGVADVEVRKQPTILPAKQSPLSGTELQKLPVDDVPSVPEPPSSSPCSSPQVSSSRSPSRSRRECTTGSPVEITLLSSDPDSDIIETSGSENHDVKASIQVVPHERLESTQPGTNEKVGRHIPLTRLSEDLSRPSGSGRTHTNIPSVREQRWHKSVTHTSTPRGHSVSDTVCSQHRHFGPACRPRTHGNRKAELIILSDSDS